MNAKATKYIARFSVFVLFQNVMLQKNLIFRGTKIARGLMIYAEGKIDQTD